MNIHIITLGCSKNLVDSEVLLHHFRANGHTVFHDSNTVEADAVIINTCGFILDAKKESIDTILQYATLRRRGKIGKLIVMGCLSERYKEDLEKEIPEVDGFYGVWDHLKIVRALGGDDQLATPNDRFITTPGHYAYLKIAEGCNRRCSFCAIPGIRGRQQSRPINDLLSEAVNLSAKGVKELILIAQDLTGYGIDFQGRKMLPELLEKLSEIDSIQWIRMHYAYPTGFPGKIMDIMAGSPKICNYLDIPIQHISDRILKAMNRGHDRKRLEKLLQGMRDRVPGVALRTTLLVGYPGETDQEFEELAAFIRFFRFDRLGVFPYSHEEGTPAYRRIDDIPEAVKQQRVSRIMEIQQEISLELNMEKIGKTYRVIIDRKEGDYHIGRTEHDSPEVDNEVLIKTPGRLEPGTFTEVKITDAGAFDLYAEIC